MQQKVEQAFLKKRLPSGGPNPILQGCLNWPGLGFRHWYFLSVLADSHVSLGSGSTESQKHFANLNLAVIQFFKKIFRTFFLWPLDVGVRYGLS